MFHPASLEECIATHQRARAFYLRQIPHLVNGTRAEAEQRLATHERCLTALQNALELFNDLNRTVPTLEQAIEYGKEIGISRSEVEDWHDYCETFGWKLRDGEIRNWKAAMRRSKRISQRTAAPAIMVNKASTDTEPQQWREFLKASGKPFQEHRYAPGFMRIDFAAWKKERKHAVAQN